MPDPRRLIPAAAVLLLALSACDTPFGTQLARAQAKSVVNEVIHQRVPGIDPTPVTDCIIDNATGSEIVDIAGAAVTGITDQTVVKVFEIAGRPDTVDCFLPKAGPALIARIIVASQGV